ncbi:hypothetical protein QOT17_017376 [Balamuthia mandrillaris]
MKRRAGVVQETEEQEEPTETRDSTPKKKVLLDEPCEKDFAECGVFWHPFASSVFRNLKEFGLTEGVEYSPCGMLLVCDLLTWLFGRTVAELKGSKGSVLVNGTKEELKEVLRGFVAAGDLLSYALNSVDRQLSTGKQQQDFDLDFLELQLRCALGSSDDVIQPELVHGVASFLSYVTSELNELNVSQFRSAGTNDLAIRPFHVLRNLVADEALGNLFPLPISVFEEEGPAALQEKVEAFLEKQEAKLNFAFSGKVSDVTQWKEEHQTEDQKEKKQKRMDSVVFFNGISLLGRLPNGSLCLDYETFRDPLMASDVNLNTSSEPSYSSSPSSSTSSSSSASSSTSAWDQLHLHRVHVFGKLAAKAGVLAMADHCLDLLFQETRTILHQVISHIYNELEAISSVTVEAKHVVGALEHCCSGLRLFGFGTQRFPSDDKASAAKVEYETSTRSKPKSDEWQEENPWINALVDLGNDEQGNRDEPYSVEIFGKARAKTLQRQDYEYLLHKAWTDQLNYKTQDFVELHGFDHLPTGEHAYTLDYYRSWVLHVEVELLVDLLALECYDAPTDTPKQELEAIRQQQEVSETIHAASDRWNDPSSPPIQLPWCEVQQQIERASKAKRALMAVMAHFTGDTFKAKYAAHLARKVAAVAVNVLPRRTQLVIPIALWVALIAELDNFGLEFSKSSLLALQSGVESFLLKLILDRHASSLGGGVFFLCL